MFRKSILLFFLALAACSTNKNMKVYDSELSNYDYPFEVKSYSLSSQRQNLKMRYMDVGNPQSTKVAVLLHGKNFAGYYWERIAKDLMAKSYRVIIPDQIGFGKSSKPQNYQYSLSQYAINTKALLDSIGIKNYTLVGHSMGGMIATQMAYMFSEPSKLILVNPIGLETYLDYVEFKDPEHFYQSELTKTLDDNREYQKKFYYDGEWNESYEKLLEAFSGQRESKDWPIVAWNNSLTYAPIFNDDIVSKFKKIKTKTYLILGTRDRTAPGKGNMRSSVKRDLGNYKKLGKEVLAQNRSIKLIELPGLGHMPQVENYEAFSKVFYPLFY